MTRLLFSSLLIFAFGFAVGNYFRVEDLIFPMQTKKITEDFTLKAGTLVRSRHFDGSIIDNKYEIILDHSYSKYPLFGPVTDAP